MAACALAGDCRAVLKGERQVVAAPRPAPAQPGEAGPRRTRGRRRIADPRDRSRCSSALRQWRLRDGARPGRAALRHLPRRHAAGDRGGAAARHAARLEGLPGLGAAKLERYGDAILDVVAATG